MKPYNTTISGLLNTGSIRVVPLNIGRTRNPNSSIKTVQVDFICLISKIVEKARLYREPEVNFNLFEITICNLNIKFH